MRKLTKILLLWLLSNLYVHAPDAQQPAKPATSSHTLALIITNDNPRFLKPIASAWLDGIDMERLLKSMNFDVLRLSNPEHKRIRRTIDSLSHHTQDINTLILYISMHALCVNNMDFYLASDADTLGNLRKTAFSLYGTIDMLKAGNRQLRVIVFYDGCRQECKELQENFERWGKLKRPDLSNVFIFFASSLGKEALGYKTSLRNSIFTGCLLKHLCDTISLYAICTVVIKEVMETSLNEYGDKGQQVPLVENHTDQDIFLNPVTLPMDGPVVSIGGPTLFQKLYHHENESPAVPVIWKLVYTGSIS